MLVPLIWPVAHTFAPLLELVDDTMLPPCSTQAHKPDSVSVVDNQTAGTSWQNDRSQQ